MPFRSGSVVCADCSDAQGAIGAAASSTSAPISSDAGSAWICGTPLRTCNRGSAPLHKLRNWSGASILMPWRLMVWRRSRPECDGEPTNAWGSAMRDRWIAGPRNSSRSSGTIATNDGREDAHSRNLPAVCPLWGNAHARANKHDHSQVCGSLMKPGG